MVKNPPASAGDTGSFLVPEDPTHAEQLNPCTTTTEPELWSPGAATTEPTHPRACALQQEKKKVKKVKSLSHVWLFVTPWTVAYQASPSMGFSRQEYWSGLSFPSPGDLSIPGIETGFPALNADGLPSEPPGKSNEKSKHHNQSSPCSSQLEKNNHSNKDPVWPQIIILLIKNNNNNNNKWGLIKFTRFCTAKETRNTMNKQPTAGRKYLQMMWPTRA